VKYVLDTSVILKWFLKEEFGDIALNIKNAYVHGEIDLIEPDLLLYEFVNVLRFNVGVPGKELEELIEVLFSYQFNLVVPTVRMLKLAQSFALMYNITVYDAYYVVLAKDTNSYFVTADGKLHKKISNLPFVRLLSKIEMT
jgi:predicted nucleic acid-binding protein